MYLKVGTIILAQTRDGTYTTCKWILILNFLMFSRKDVYNLETLSYKTMSLARVKDEGQKHSIIWKVI